MEFDYVIIGAGSAGCVLANRLSANPETSVALIEAGKRDTNFMIHMPRGYGKTTAEPGESWHYFSQPEPFIENRQMLLPRGKGLGGSSNINGMIYIRGQRADYDIWSQLGATGWGWDDVLPYFARSSTHAVERSGLYGDGPLWVEQTPERDTTSDAIIAAFNEIGVQTNPDFNGTEQDGVGYFHANIKDGKRWSAAKAYLHPVMDRTNLTVFTEAHAEQITFEGKRANGLRFRDKRGKQQISARHEVILSAGAYQSPQLLQLSGIGPARHLQSLGVEIIADRAQVGANLQDHLIPPMAWKINRGAYSHNNELKAPKVVWHVLRYLLTGRGPMAGPAAEVGAFVKSDPALDRPDIQFHCLPVSGDLEKASAGEKSQLQPHPGLSLAPYFLRPESRGSAMAGSPDPHVPPAIVHNYLQAREDQQVTVKAMKIARMVAATDILKNLIVEETDPGASAQSDEELLAFAQQYGMTGYHPVGTCRMGADENAVVDPQLRVKGVEGLRVIDASVMPRLISGNTHATTVMIAEKASDMILANSQSART
ncbi:GMC family oxidoreductase [Parasphingorhabdus halotolerans]|uniref:GMC family oxidoreductase n=1 Tax=Parasphingorhabdus halotolerans TaxID=2725558 RepID=UPI001B3A0FA3|nr:GMC family oxidoreductase N-terminal domain-containing protein [Parasphingorhabdus halotolerans]